MIKLSSAIPCFIMIICPLVLYYFLLQEQSTPPRQTTTQSIPHSILTQAIKHKKKIITKIAKASKQGDFSDQFFQDLSSKMSEGNHDLLRQLLALDPLHQSAILSLKDDTLSWLSKLTMDQRSDVLHILHRRPSGEWQENLESLQRLPEDEFRTVLSHQHLAQKIPKEMIDQSPFGAL
jgi:hypothetical protein